VQDLSKLTSLSKQAASKTLSDLQRLGLVRRRPATWTPAGGRPS
jgi:DNA-binding IclR family transcriptional regulator